MNNNRGPLLLIGLGNPGHRYQLTRHNIGYLVIDALARHWNSPRAVEQSQSTILKVKHEGCDVILAKPQTYMNLSGEAVQPLIAFYKIPLENLLVIHDDIDQPFGQMKFQKNRGTGGHNGIRNIHEKLGSADYARLKIGIGRPSEPKMAIDKYVLQNFAPEQEDQLREIIQRAGEAALTFIDVGFQRAQNAYNAESANEHLDDETDTNETE